MILKGSQRAGGRQLVECQREERQKLKDRQEKRWNVEARARSERLAKGLCGIWHRFTGKYDRVKRHNERETLLAYQRACRKTVLRKPEFSDFRDFGKNHPGFQTSENRSSVFSFLIP